MAFAGLRKQINKANQYVTEKMGGAEGTKLDLDFVEMERKTDVTCELVEELQLKTKEFLQPNPTARAKMAAVKGISKLSGQAKSNTYPQPEGVLGDCMLTYGKKLGEDSIFSQCMIEFGESMKQMADIKYSLDDNIKQNFLEPLHHLQTKDLKEVMHHRKKLQGRRLDFDCKRRRQAKGGRTSPYPGSPAHSQGSQRQGSNITDDEIKQAEEKFAESLQLAQIGMFNLLDNDIEQVAQMAFFAEGLLEYHQQCVEILKVLAENLQEKREEAANRPKMEFVPKTLSDLHIEGVIALDCNNGRRPPTFGSTQNLHTSNPAHQAHPAHLAQWVPPAHPAPLRHSSSIGNLPAHYGLAYNYNNQRNGKGREHSVNTNTTTKDPFNMWDSQTDPWGGGAHHNNNVNNNKTNRNNNGTFLPPPNNGGFVRPSPAPRNVIQNTPLYRMDPWSGDSLAGSPVLHKPPSMLELFPGGNGQNQPRSNNASPLPSPMKSPAKTPIASLSKGPSCTALYDFEPENPGELAFKENDVITLINKIDDNWFEGSVNGRQGYFPVSYVQVNTPLPNM